MPTLLFSLLHYSTHIEYVRISACLIVAYTRHDNPYKKPCYKTIQSNIYVFICPSFSLLDIFFRTPFSSVKKRDNVYVYFNPTARTDRKISPAVRYAKIITVAFGSFSDQSINFHIVRECPYFYYKNKKTQ